MHKKKYIFSKKKMEKNYKEYIRLKNYKDSVLKKKLRYNIKENIIIHKNKIIKIHI